MRDYYLKMKNKDFAYQTIRILIENKCGDSIKRLTDPDFCKIKFDMNFPILQKVCSYGSIPREEFLDVSGNRRYYPEPITVFGNRYIVCNDWYYNGKTNRRDTRTAYLDWVLSQRK